MFQYAAARNISLTRGLPLSFDITGFTPNDLHEGFKLNKVFNCEAHLASKEDVRSVLGWRASPFVRRILARPELISLRGNALVVEPHFHYWSGLISTQESSYLQGYWQSEKYFANVSEIIRNDFNFVCSLSAINSSFVEKIVSEGTAVSIHVRRGDYVFNLRANAMHGLCPLSYYQSAVRYIAERVDEPIFYIFSDDINWARANLQIQYPCHYIDHNHGAESYNDMRLMSLCSHHIIANSSFSWWGAWLNPFHEKIVVAPARWFSSDEFFLDDLYPKGWVKL